MKKQPISIDQVFEKNGLKIPDIFKKRAKKNQDYKKVQAKTLLPANHNWQDFNINETTGLALPENLIVGGADADLQVVGDADPHSEEAMWKHFAEEKGIEPPGEGAYRYEHWEEFIDFLQELGVKHYRTSISISRLITRDGEINNQGLNWYQEYFQALKNAGIKIYATLYHWELPQFLQERGGWENRAVIDWYLKHVTAVVKNLDTFIEEYYLFNEPWCICLVSHHLGVHAPGKTNLKSGLQAAHHVLLAQGKGMKVIKDANQDAKVSTVLNMEPAYPVDDKPENLRAAWLAEMYYNWWFSDPIFLGKYPESMANLYAELNAMPDIRDGDMAEIMIGEDLHALGINFYRSALVEARSDWDGTGLPYDYAYEATEARNDLGWTIHPPGLSDLLIYLMERYQILEDKSIQITENGTACAIRENAQGFNSDQLRVYYFVQHLIQVMIAIRAGVPVSHYFLWTLCKNYEWAEGFSEKSSFGISDYNPGRDPEFRKYASYYLWQYIFKYHALPSLDILNQILDGTWQGDEAERHSELG